MQIELPDETVRDVETMLAKRGENGNVSAYIDRTVQRTNVLVSALINPGGLPDQLLQRWESDEFTLVTSAEQLDEL